MKGELGRWASGRAPDPIPQLPSDLVGSGVGQSWQTHGTGRATPHGNGQDGGGEDGWGVVEKRAESAVPLTAT